MIDRRGVLKRLLAGGAGSLAAMLVRAADSAMPAEERALVDQLIEAVGRRSDVSFIRNGKSYSAQDAATFLRKKFEARGGGLKSAEEFIDRIASKSSMSGDEYTIKLGDGREMPSGPYLRAELQRLKSR